MDDLWVIGGSLDPKETYWIKDADGIVQVEKEFIDAHSDWYRPIGRVECGAEWRNYYLLED